MKVSRSFWGVLIGAVMTLAGVIGISYFLIFPEEWGGASFGHWMPVSIIAVCLGVICIIASLCSGIIIGLAIRSHQKHEKDVA